LTVLLISVCCDESLRCTANDAVCISVRNVLAQVPRGSAEIVAAAVRTVFAQPDAEHVR
jgi:transposase-like protein